MKRAVMAVIVGVLALLPTVCSSVQAASGAFDIEIDAGAIYFRGETVDFYLLTTFDGLRVTANITNVALYRELSLIWQANVLTDVKRIADGLFWAKYQIPTNASFGTYTLLAEATYTAGVTIVKTAALRSFVLSSTLTDQKARISFIEGVVAAIIADVSVIKVNLSDVGEVVTGIEGNVATIRTDVGTIKATVSEIDNGVATIQTDIGTIKLDLSEANITLTRIDGNVVTITADLGTVRNGVTEVKTIATETKTAATDAKFAAQGSQSVASSLATTTNILFIVAIVAAAAAILALVTIIELGLMLMKRFNL